MYNIIKPVLHPKLEEKILKDMLSIDDSKDGKDPKIRKQVLEGIEWWINQAMNSFEIGQIITKKDISDIKKDFQNILKDIRKVLEKY